MAPDSSVKPMKAGLSLYANLLDPSNASAAPGTISRAPVVFRQPLDTDSQDETSAQKQQISAASLRFQPTKRPQIITQKPKPKAPLSKTAPPTAPQATLTLDAPTVASRFAAKSTIADWTGAGDEDDVNGFYGGEKRQRGGRKKRKKNKEDSHMPQNWDDIYDPSRPNSYEEYKHSDEKIREVREWKDRLYAHRMARRRSSYSDSDNESRTRLQMNNQFAPPPMSFAPPLILSEDTPLQDLPPSIPNDSTGDDAYARRLQLSQAQHQAPPTHPPPLPAFLPTQMAPPPPPPPTAEPSLSEQPPPPPPPHIAPIPPTISRAPVRYNLPAPPSELPRSEAELESALEKEAAADPEEENEPRSLRPGQKGFAARLMSKYGWTAGTGLGASASGIVAPLRVQVEKQKKKPDSEGGGFVGPGGRGKIIGGKKKAGGDGKEEGRFGAMSEVVMLKGMVDGMDLDAEMELAGDGGIMQEIGEECGEKYGRVERVFIDRSSPTSAPVFVKFTSQLSALRAVNALEGRIFNGNTISARFFDTEKFEKGIYE